MNSPCYHTVSFLNQKRLLGKRMTRGLHDRLRTATPNEQRRVRRVPEAPEEIGKPSKADSLDAPVWAQLLV